MNGSNESSSLDIIFVISGRPLPAMLDMALFATQQGHKTAVIILERGQDDLKPDEALIAYEVITIQVPYKGVDVRRFLDVPAMYKKLKSNIKERLKPGGVIVTASYDLLFFAYLISGKGKYKIRHQVRDLHSLQLMNTFKARVFTNIERSLLKKVEQIIISSPEFHRVYYSRIFKGKVTLLQNVPAKSTWHNFVKQNNNLFTIGFIGILRYKPSLFQLIDAVEVLNAEGITIKVLFAGGGPNDDLKERIKSKELFEFEGPYEYTKDIKRLYAKIDLIYAVYDSYDPNCQLAMPNKFYESIIAKIPMVVASNTYVAKQVRQFGIGTDVLSGDKQALVNQLRIMQDQNSWYQTALINLNKINADQFYREYHDAMRESVLI